MGELINSSRCGAFLGVSCIIIYLYSGVVFVFAPYLQPNHPFYFYFTLVLANFALFMIYWTFSRSVFSDPGYVSRELDDNLDFSIEMVEKLKTRSSQLKKSIQEKNKKLKELQRRKNNDLESYGFSSPKQLKEEINELYLSSIKETLYCFQCAHIKKPRVHHCK